jgi:DedD protein
MQRGFGGTAFEPAEVRADRELTLGPMTLVFLGLLLCGICALCFVWGYSVGHRAPMGMEPAQSASAGPPAAQILSNQPKPGASASGQQTHVDAPPVSSDSPGFSSPPAGNVEASTATPASSATGSLPTGGAVVQAALPASGASVQPNTTGGLVQPAFGANSPWMVQIAAVSHSEDADVLVSALRKRGYAVSARRDPGDNLIHVQVGPFSNHADAASMRQRLLNDGYNAMIEP